jgi:hypothetical protein
MLFGASRWAGRGWGSGLMLKRSSLRDDFAAVLGFGRRRRPEIRAPEGTLRAAKGKQWEPRQRTALGLRAETTHTQ